MTPLTWNIVIISSTSSGTHAPPADGGGSSARPTCARAAGSSSSPATRSDRAAGTRRFRPGAPRRARRRESPAAPRCRAALPWGWDNGREWAQQSFG
ncbi:hypothetical protein G6F22_019979 [Rhizopus arrhizus]|nr:hypothetical protein G6F22_019979 [Rhizopus arrhizus]